MNAVWMPMFMLANPMVQVDFVPLHQNTVEIAPIELESDKENAVQNTEMTGENSEESNCIFSVENNGYTVDPKINIHCTGQIFDHSTLVVEHNKQKEIVQAETDMMYLCKEVGTYFAYLQSQEIKSDVHSWHYVDQSSQIQMTRQNEQDDANHTVDCQGTNGIENHHSLNEDAQKIESPFQTNGTMSETSNIERNNVIESMISDDVAVTIDQQTTIVPVATMATSHFTIPQREEKPMNNDWNQKEKKDSISLKEVTSNIDNFGNESTLRKSFAEDGTIRTKQWIFAQTLTPNLEVQDRTWIIDDQKQINFEQKSQRIEISSCNIVAMNDHKIRIVFDSPEKVIWIKVNGKKIHIPKIHLDRVHQSYMEFSISQKKCVIEVKVIDENDHTRKIKKVIAPVLRKHEISKHKLWLKTLWMKWLHG